jgi:hypothetical protein
MKFRIRHAAVPAALLGLGLLATACGGSSGTAATPSTAHSSPASGSSSASQGSHSSAPASPSATSTSSVAAVGKPCPAGDIAKATQQALPAQQELTAAGFTLVTSMPSGTVYIDNTTYNIKICGWTGYYTNGTLFATVGLGSVSAMGTPGHWVESSYPTSVRDQESYATQALKDTSDWAALYKAGPNSAYERLGYPCTVYNADGTAVSVDLYMSV